MKVAIETQQLSKTFHGSRGWRRAAHNQRIPAVAGVDLTVPAGELFGLLGANGAGKTTLVKILCSLILPDDGSATVAGHDLSQPGKIRQSVGLVVSDERSFYWRLTARQNLAFFAAMYDLRGRQAEGRIDQVLEQVELQPIADRAFSVLSAGMRQRLAMARSLLHRPQLLFLDEPSRSLDPVAKAHLHALIRQLNGEQGVTIFLITHDLGEAEALCHRVGVMQAGQIQVTGRPEDLRRQLKAKIEYRLLVDRLGARAEADLGQVLAEFNVESSGDGQLVSFALPDGGPALTAVLDRLRESDVQIRDIVSRPATLEEVFARYSGQERQAK
ncbi:MAG: ABC transporter ATP-binding protein [Chloroflexota bacterium]|jgi:ABC-2 type transport system ATP-binding protein